MIEYDFDPGFWNPIVKGIKTKTMRNMRTKPRRHARVDEPIELWALVDGRRLQILRAKCTAIEGVKLHLARGLVAVGPIFRHRDTWRPLSKKAREQLAIDTGHAGGWKEAAQAYLVRYGIDPWFGTLVTWGPRDYDGPIPSTPQLRDLKVLAQHKILIPSYGKISVQVGYSLLILKWAEIADPTHAYFDREKRGEVPIQITALGREILDRFDR